MKSLIVIGGGQIGTSVARKAAQNSGFDTITIVEKNPSYRADLAGLFANDIAQGRVRITDQPEPDTLARADVTVLATQISEFGNVTADIAPHLKAGALLTDVGSAKKDSEDAINTALDRAGVNGDKVIYIGSHPFNGEAGQGPLTSKTEMFENKPVFVMKPGEQASPARMEALDRLENFWRGLGANITQTDAFSHDRYTALLSHFQTLLVVTVTAGGKDEDGTMLDGYGNARTAMRNLTRPGNANEKMWVPIFEHNRNGILQAYDGFDAQMQKLKGALNADTPGKLKEFLEDAHNFRSNIADNEPREDIESELFRWSEQQGGKFETLPEAKAATLSPRFNHASRIDFARGSLLPAALAAVSTMNARAMIGTEIRGIDITKTSNPTFRDGTALMLSSPAYLASLMHSNRDYLLPVIAAFEPQMREAADEVRRGDKAAQTQRILASADIRQHAMPPARKGADVDPAYDIFKRGQNAGSAVVSKI